MNKLVTWIRANVKEGANVAEAEEMISLDSIEAIKTKEQALDIMSKNAAFVSAKDAEISRAVDAHDKKFTAEKLPALIKAEREKMQKELNPDLTEDQKRLNELETKLAEKEKAEKLSSLKAELRKKAKELEYDPLKAERFALYGDEKTALNALELEATEFKEAVKSQVDALTKQQFTKTTPSSGDPVKAEALDQKYQEAQKAGNVNQMMMLKEQMAKNK